MAGNKTRARWICKTKNGAKQNHVGEVITSVLLREWQKIVNRSEVRGKREEKDDNISTSDFQKKGLGKGNGTRKKNGKPKGLWVWQMYQIDWSKQ